MVGLVLATVASAAAAETLAGSLPEPLPVKYVGNTDSLKFHRPSCPFAQVMYRRRRLDFHFRHEAIERGFSPCCWCLPKRWKHLEGRLLTQFMGDPRIDQQPACPYSN